MIRSKSLTAPSEASIEQEFGLEDMPRVEGEDGEGPEDNLEEGAELEAE